MKPLFPSFKKYASHPLAIFVLLAIAPLPFLYFLASFYFGMDELDSVELAVRRLHKKSIDLRWQKERESSFFAEIGKADHFFIDKNIETLVFLEPEITKLQALPHTLKQNEGIKSRLQFLKDGPNKLRFTEENIRRSEVFQEVEEKQQHVVEMNEEDLKRLLVLIEGVAIWPYLLKENRPQLIIRDFDLTKKPLDASENVFIVNMQLLKRESLKKKE